jgi:crotonobetaine/carnitine-CoA ligase
VPEYDVSLVDDQDNPVAMGEAGEIVTRPLRPFSMMSAYHGMAEQTVAAWRNLWFHTGDMARQDADGYLYFVDRKKDAIRRRGENISSAELESALMSHGGFVETAIVAVPSPLGEDDVKAFLVLAPGVPFEFAEFIAWCEDQLPAFMIPRYVELVADLPRTPTQRVERYRLRKRGNGPRTWDREIEGFVGIIGDQTVVESPAESPSNLV